MQRRTLKLTFSYDGTEYCGWQVQPNGPTIQQAIEKALAKIFCQRIRVTASGRTDAGVHAIGQVASCSLESELSPDLIRRALNGNLPKDIRILHVERAPDDFHAIRDAVGKRYRYVIQDGPVEDVFRRRYAWFLQSRLDDALMHEAGQSLVGEHDFKSYQAAGSDRKTTVRIVRELSVKRSCPTAHELAVEVEANGFLYNMVRNIVGTLVEVGLENQSVAWPGEVLHALDRKRAGRTAPPHGLTLVSVVYDGGSRSSRPGNLRKLRFP